jgi:hypothetical protein
MTGWNGESELAELAHLPVGHPARTELVTRIGRMDPIGQERWRRMLRETDLLYQQLGEVEIPIELEERLLQIPATRPRRQGGLERMLTRPMAWTALAACLLIAVGILAYLEWPRTVAPPPLATLDPVLAEKIAALAVQHCQGQASLEISSSDAGKVRAVLASEHLPVSVTVSPPRETLMLRGGGTCEFGPARAAYTSWQAAGLNFTLFQFNGASLCVPEKFLTTTAIPAALGAKGIHYHVVIWPGHGQEGDWAMVLENDAALSAFMARNCR